MNRHWGVSIGDVVDVVRTWNPQRDGRGIFNYIDLSAVDQEAKAIVAASSIACSAAPSRARQLVQTDDILVSTVRPNLNAVAHVSGDFDGATASTGFCVLRPSPKRLDPRYLLHWVRAPAFVDSMVRSATGASYPAVSDRIVKESVIPLPPLDEQRRIAAILDKADALRQKRKRAIALLDSLALSIFLEMFGDPRINPLSWPVSQIGRLLAASLNFGSMNPPQSSLKEWLSLRVSNIQDWSLDLHDMKFIDLKESEVERFTLADGDVVLARAIASQEHLGKCVVVEPGNDKWAFDSHLMRIRLDRDKLEPVYLRELFRTPGGRALFLRSTRKTTVQYNINTKELASLSIPLPPIDTQRTFVSRVAEINSIRASIERATSRASNLFASLQHRAFSGQL